MFSLFGKASVSRIFAAQNAKLNDPFFSFQTPEGAITPCLTDPKTQNIQEVDDERDIDFHTD